MAGINRKGGRLALESVAGLRRNSHFDADAPLDGWTAEAINERSGIVNMIRAPAECRQWLRPALGPINTVRFVMACLNRQAPDYVDEKLVLSRPCKIVDSPVSLGVPPLFTPCNSPQNRFSSAVF